MVTWDKFKEGMYTLGIDIDGIRDEPFSDVWISMHPDFISRVSKPIEEKIKPLVIALNYAGYETHSSCEGHSLLEQMEDWLIYVRRGDADILDSNSYNVDLRIYDALGMADITIDEHPYVQFYTKEDKNLENTLKVHNMRAGVQWQVDDYALTTSRITPIGQYTIEQMQEDIAILAEDVLAYG